MASETVSRPKAAASATLGWARAAALATLPLAATAVSGGWATRANIPGWYAGLARPPLTPPNWVFAPAWTLLYSIMAYVAFRLWRHPPGPGRTAALVAFHVQLALNAAWSWAFFGFRNPALGLADIAALLIAILATIVLVMRVDRVGAALLAPYLAWVSYATYLNGGIWWLNR